MDSASPNQNANVKFLLVDDDEIDVQSIKRAFKKLRLANEIVVANDGIEALEILRGTDDTPPLPDPYLILLDLNMPRMNGLEFLDVIRADPALSHALVFVLTTSTDDHDRFAAYDKHVAGYIVKSRTQATFMEALEMIDHYWRVIEFPKAPPKPQ